MSPEQLNDLLANLFGQPFPVEGTNYKNCKGVLPKPAPNTGISPASLLVLLGLLSGSLQVNSVLVDTDQQVQILLSGSLRRKTELDKILDKIAPLSCETVIQAIIRHFS